LILELAGKWQAKRFIIILENSLWIDVKIPYEPGNALARAYNRAMENTLAEWVLFLDHDLFICNPLWYEMCLDAIRQLDGKRVGWITAKCNRIACPDQKHYVKFDNNDIVDHIKTANSLYKEKGNSLVKTDAIISGFFILTNKTAWKAAGGFKQVNGSIFGIDNEYKRDLTRAGFDTYVMEGLYFYHLYRQKTKLFQEFLCQKA
jgi:GT2 family glycosyltransferase